MQLLGEAPGLLSFLFTPDDELVVEPDALPGADGAAVLDAALRVLELPALHPNMAQVYRDKATALAAGLERDDERDGARQALRGFIEKS
jgi:glutamyl-tRNA synthetase